MTVTPQTVLSSLSESLGDSAQLELSENVAQLVEMFCYLFELKRCRLAFNRTQSRDVPKIPYR